MIEVKCPSCKAGYQVDERRVPATGLKMRCPKCGESFQVEAPGAAPKAAPVLGAALGLGPAAASKTTSVGVAPAAPPRPGPPRPGQKQTMIGVAPAAMTSPLRTDIELESIDDVSELSDEEFEADLPSATAAWEAPDEMALAPPKRRAPAQEIELPGMELESAPPDSFDSAELPDIPGMIGLPAAGGRSAPAAFGELDLGPSSDSGDEFNLPSVGGELPDLRPPQGAARGGRGTTSSDFAELPDLHGDLPDLDPAGLPDLGGSLPDLGGELPDLSGELPLVGNGPKSINLPSAASHLPVSSDALPPTRGSGQLAPGRGANGPQNFGERDFGEAEDIFGGGTAARPETLPPGAPKEGSAFGEVNFGGADDGDEFDAFPTEKAGTDGGASRGNTGYGEVAFDGNSGDLALGADVEREIAPGPPGPAAAVTAAVELPGAPQSKGPQVVVTRPGLSSKTKIFAGVGLAVALGGGVLGLVPDLGPYGAFFLIDAVKEEANGAELTADVKAAQKRLGLDTVSEGEAAYRETTRGQEDAPRFRARQAYRAFLGLYRHVRFGADSTVVADAKVLLAKLREEEKTDAKYFELAQLAESITLGKSADVVKRGETLLGRSVDHAALVGEAALRVKDVALAEKAFSAVAKGAPSARANYGLARAKSLGGKVAEAQNLALEARRLSPQHVGSLLLSAELSLTDLTKDESLQKELTDLTGQTKVVSANERVVAFILLGRLHLLRSRLKQAEAAFGDALKLESGNSEAQRGLAETLFESGRYGEALARFEAALKADPSSLSAELGIVQAKLRLESLDDAAKILTELEKKYPKSTRVQYWAGRAKESIGERDLAQKAYEAAIDFNEDCAELVQAFVSLTRLHSQVGNSGAADLVIAQAEKRFPENADVYRALAELAASRGQYEEAIRQFDRAIAIDNKNIGLHFLRGIALRQARKFEDAMTEFDEVERVEKDYPGLALERGNLYEAAGHSEEALKSYEAALAAAPNDIDLMLRVGCGKANVGQTKASMDLLSKVFDARANSAEVNYCMGLALLREGQNLPEARRYFERAVGLDMTRATYHLYVGWVGTELRDFGLAARALDKAIELDQTLADAYWQRGILRVRQGAVKDAELDLRKALELSPTRYEAHAALAEAYMQTGKEQEAMVEWKAAVDNGFPEAFWHFQYGRLLMDNRFPADAKVQLEQAIAKVEKQVPPPAWLWEAHRLVAMAMGRTKDALKHWQIFAEHSSSSPYMNEALREMKAIIALP